MSDRDISEAGNPDLAGSFAAMLRAAKQARETAILTNTAIILSLDGKVVRVDADTLRRQKAEEEAGTDSVQSESPASEA